MQKLTVKEYSKRKDVSEKTVYSWIKKDQVNYTVERVNGRSITYILLPTVQPMVNEVNETIYPDEEQNMSLQNHNVLTSPDLVEFMREMSGYIELAGQAKLLTDSEHRTKQEYFQINQENKQLIEEKATLKAQIELLQDKLKASEEKHIHSWWRKL